MACWVLRPENGRVAWVPATRSVAIEITEIDEWLTPCVVP